MNNQQAGLAGPLTQEAATGLERVKYVLYARKSTESDEKQALSIDSQIKEMLRIAERDNLEVVDIRRESHSAKDSGQRPVFNEILNDVRSGRYTGILTWAPDRLSRNAGDLGSLVDLMDQKLLIEVRSFGQKFTNSPNEKFLLMLLGSTAKLENDNKSENVKRGLRTRVEMGLWPNTAPTGYINSKRVDQKCHIFIDPDRAAVIKQIFEKVAYDNWSGRKLYHWLRFDLNFRTRSDHHLSLSNIYHILSNHAYYGMIEYPRGSGNWYEGKHKAIISKDLFIKAQEQIKRDNIVRSETREFAFTKLMTCGNCGSGITAEEKYKKLKDGTTNRYVYYGCGRSKNHSCKSPYIREEELINQLANLIDTIDLNELGIRHKLEAELERHQRFQKGVLGLSSDQDEKDEKEINLRKYAKYLLKEGSVSEKRELLGCLKGRMVMENRAISLEKHE